MIHPRIAIFTLLALLAFAGNSLLCRLALHHTAIDAATFTTVRLIAGALTLWVIVRLRHTTEHGSSNWLSALALFAYAAPFSFAYVELPTGTGALLAFGAVQTTMIGYGLWKGERLHALQFAGLALALGGLAGLLLPGISTPPLRGASLMLTAGTAWGVYSILGRASGDPTDTTAGNFLRSVPMTIALSLIMAGQFSTDTRGIWIAIISGAITSGLGYISWYAALKGLRATQAATVQLSVPVIAAGGGILFLGERPTLRLLFATIAILGGIALVVLNKPVTK